VNAAVQSLYPNLSSHSIKRGALMELLQSGVPLETLQVIAKHRSLKTLLIYLDSARVADAIGLPQAAVNL
jgi:site-specific recombinase XerD